MRETVSPHTYQHLRLSLFFILVILISMQWYLIMALVCISLIVNDAEHCNIFICHLYTLLITIAFGHHYFLSGYKSWTGGFNLLCKLTTTQAPIIAPGVGLASLAGEGPCISFLCNSQHLKWYKRLWVNVFCICKWHSSKESKCLPTNINAS